MEKEFKVPTEIIDLPSLGLIYPESNPLSTGKIEMKYMSAKEEDILTNQSLIEKGIVLDELMKSMIVSPINYDDLIIGDINAIYVAARILGYGKDYSFTYSGELYNVDLSTVDNKEIDTSKFKKGINEFDFILPNAKIEITYKLLTHKDDKDIEQELRGLKKISKEISPELSTKLKYTITSVNGDRDIKTIRNFVDSGVLLARDSRALRNHIKEMQPDVNLSFTTNSGEEATIPTDLSFFWPDI